MSGLCPKVLTAEKSALAATFHQTMLDLASHKLDAPGSQQELVNTQNRIADAIASLGRTAMVYGWTCSSSCHVRGRTS